MAKLRLQHQKAAIISGFSATAKESSKDLTITEAQLLIKHLKQMQAGETPDQLFSAEKMRRKIISMAHEVGWKQQQNPSKVDMKKLDDWCTKYGYLHKQLNDYTYHELPKLITQFEKAYGHYIKNI